MPLISLSVRSFGLELAAESFSNWHLATWARLAQSVSLELELETSPGLRINLREQILAPSGE